LNFFFRKDSVEVQQAKAAYDKLDGKKRFQRLRRFLRHFKQGHFAVFCAVCLFCGLVLSLFSAVAAVVLLVFSLFFCMVSDFLSWRSQKHA
jgi:hypothetical protein